MESEMLTLNEKLTIFALIVGPILAVLLSIVLEATRRTHDRKLHIMRLLLANRHLPGTTEYNTAINLIPAEFNSQSEVMAAWRKYHALVREEHVEQAAQEAHFRRLAAAQSSLIFEIMKSVGLKLSEGDIQTEVYISNAFAERDRMNLEYIKAMPRIAAAMEQQVQMTRLLIQGAPNQQTAANQQPQLNGPQAAA